MNTPSKASSSAPPSLDPLEGAEFRRRVQRREADALSVLFDRCFDSIYAWSCGQCDTQAGAEALTESVFDLIHQWLPSYDPSTPIMSWLVGVAASALDDFPNAVVPPSSRASFPSWSDAVTKATEILTERFSSPGHAPAEVSLAPT